MLKVIVFAVEIEYKLHPSSIPNYTNPVETSPHTQMKQRIQHTLILIFFHVLLSMGFYTSPTVDSESV